MMGVEQLISTSILPLRETDTVDMALTWMEEFRVSHLPITRDEEYIALVSETEITDIEDQGTIMSDIYSIAQKPYILSGNHFYNAMQVMLEQNLSILPVLSENHSYLGAITNDIIFKELAGSLSVQNPGGIVVLELYQKDYSLSEISRIVESSDAKILSLFIKPGSTPNMLEITLKLNHINVEAIIQSFGRFNYKILTYFGENRKDDDLLLERYESLLTYLKY